jgi:RHS repeat-associated protein
MALLPKGLRLLIGHLIVGDHDGAATAAVLAVQAGDGAGNPLTSTSPEGRTSSFTYDQVGNRVSATAAAGSSQAATTSFSYDAENHLSSVAAPDAGETRYGYDEVGNRTSRQAFDAPGSTNGSGQYGFGFDAANGAVSNTLPSGRTTSASLDALGRTTRTTATGGSSTADGALAAPTADMDASISYTAAGQVKKVDYDDPATGDVTYTYDEAGRVLSLTRAATPATATTAPSPATATVYTYSVRGLLASTTTDGTTTTYAYDAAGRLTGTTRGGVTTTRTYDADGLLTSVSEGANGVLYGYDAGGRLTTLTRPGGVVESHTYDADGLLTSSVTRRGVQVLDSQVLSLDASGRVAQKVTLSGTTRYGYDAAGRLTEECRQATACTSANFTRWTYDATGRRTSETTETGATLYTYGPDDRLVATSGEKSASFGYDAAGNRTSHTTDPGTAQASTTTYAYDAAGRLTSSTAPDGSVTSFGYDGLGNRTSVDAPGTDKDATFFYDPTDSLPIPSETRGASGAVTSRLSAGPDGAAAFTVTATLGGEAAQFPVTDQVHTPTLWLDGTGQADVSVSSAPWGAARTVSVMDETAPSPKIGFTSTVDALAPAGLVHMGARDYDPSTGTFLSRDPWARPDGMSWVGTYAYTDGNPVSFWDPTGWSQRETRGGFWRGAWKWADKNWNGFDVGVGVCPVFGCIGLSVNYSDKGLNWGFESGVGLAVSYPGLNFRPVGEHKSGWSESTQLFGSAPVPGAQASYTFGDATNKSGWDWIVSAGQYPRSKGYGWGGGFVHMWKWGS